MTLYGTTVPIWQKYCKEWSKDEHKFAGGQFKFRQSLKH